MTATVPGCARGIPAEDRDGDRRTPADESPQNDVPQRHARRRSDCRSIDAPLGDQHETKSSIQGGPHGQTQDGIALMIRHQERSPPPERVGVDGNARPRRGHCGYHDHARRRLTSFRRQD